jgi:1-deoxy-D-xylulose-5-phosphate reductoisomerase
VPPSVSPAEVERFVLTVSGACTTPLAELRRRPAAEVEPPDLVDGPAITVDSATLNKGLEVIEARWLFGLSSSTSRSRPSAVVHAVVHLTDGCSP